MSFTYTNTETWSRTHARYVAGKVAADLRQMQQEYSHPSDCEIEDYVGELVSLLADGYLDTVIYGFKKDGAWLPAALRYTALSLGTDAQDVRSGGIKRGVVTTGAHFTSYLTYSAKWWGLTEQQRDNYKSNLPVQRVSGYEPSAPGGWVEDRKYVSGTGGVRRAVLGGGA